MAIAGVLSNVSNATRELSTVDTKAYIGQRRADTKQLAQALNGGDLKAAQTAFDSLAALATQNGLKNPFARQDRAAAFDAVGAALKSGDLAGAQQAFAVLHDNLLGRSTAPSRTPPGTTPDVIVTLNGSGPTGVATPAPTPIAKPPVPTPTPDPTPIAKPPVPTPGKLPPVNTLPPAPTPPEVAVSINDVKGSGKPSEQIVLNLNGGSGAKSGEQINIGISQTSSGEQISLSFGKAGSAGSTPSVQLNLGSRPSEIDIAVSQTSAGEQIAISFKSAAQSAIQALTSGATSQSASSSLSVSA